MYSRQLAPNQLTTSLVIESTYLLVQADVVRASRSVQMLAYTGFADLASRQLL